MNEILSNWEFGDDDEPRSGLGTLDEWAAHWQQTVATVGDDFTDPDEDWDPMCFIEAPALGLQEKVDRTDPIHQEAFRSLDRDPTEQDVGLMMLPIPAPAIESNGVASIVSRLGEIAMETSALKVAVVLSVWMTIAGQSEVTQGGMFEGREVGDRFEAITLYVADKTGDQHWSAPIIWPLGPGTPRRCGDWQVDPAVQSPWSLLGGVLR